jgi:signal transduction histidine kinase/CheY-like chemotaxis protein
VGITALYFWYRRNPLERSSVAAHVIALVATLALLLPIAYGMSSTIWWLSLVGFAMVHLGRRQEAKVWGMLIPVLVAASVLLEPHVQIQGAAGELPVEAGLAKVIFVVILIAMSAGFRYVAEQRAIALYDSEKRLEASNTELARHRDHLEELVRERIAEVQRALEEKARLQDQLLKSQKMESLGLLAGGVAHDLNNVLSGIVSYPELILYDLPEDSKLREPMITIMESGLRAVAIVQDLLTVARGVATIKEPLKLNNLVNSYLVSPEFKKLNQLYPYISVRTFLSEDLLNVSVSHVHIRKVMMNLVVNAFEAIHGTGTVEMSTENRYIDRPLKGYDEVSIGEYAVLSISDNGKGISDQDLERIFEPFYTKKVMGRSGTGLGLAVVWNVIQDHHGYIDVKTGESGTRFDVYIPITRDGISEKEMPLSIDSYKGAGEAVLVVDDVKTQREISCKILEKLGYQCTSVSSGEEAIEYLSQNSVDLVLLDMIMDPGISGYETYKRIIKIHPGQKAIILSGFSETEDVKKAQSLGAGQYIKKPVTIEKIGIAIKEELKKNYSISLKNDY